MDDNIEAAQVLGALMKSSGLEVELSYDGKAALELVDSFRPHILLLDVGLPLRDGYGVARAIRCDPIATVQASQDSTITWSGASISISC